MRLLPKRRWLRFSVRTLLLAVTIFCVWLGWQVRIVRERQRLLSEIVEYGGEYWDYDEWDDEGNRIELSFFRRLLGDEELGLVLLYTNVPKEFQDRLRETFAHADIDVYPPPAPADPSDGPFRCGNDPPLTQ